MKFQHFLLLSGLVFAGAFLAGIPVQAHGIHGGARGARANGTTERSGTYQTLNHGNGTFNSTVNRQPGSATGSTTWANTNGGQGNHAFANTWNNTGNGTGTGTHQASTTYANGKTSSSQGTLTRTAPGDSTYSGTHIGVNGDVTDVSKTATTSDGVRTVDSTYDNTATGKTTTVDKIYSTNANGSRQVDGNITGPNGKTSTSDQTFTRDGNGYTQTGTVTGPNGKTSTDSRDVGYVSDRNGEITRTATGSITGLNGETKQFGNSETCTKSYTPNPAPVSTTSPQD